ncbi:SARP family transcriptional regulator [Parafrankia colletiae]|uniref:SARP family transcriptional regulator n=1 Tax=Parafrankia colletiae TaxID=573497 RepID=A0A1S1R2G0_9ACTN|nr:AfsR/SARP family transcriptional regulator [Parafrankia colletiae]MCK9901558.1 AfsR/SARP family transcriptional regulator [Frankia sp. Cpl3]OHV41118.1 SARP family transcriptional regulator [Parafrankia colletiae]
MRIEVLGATRARREDGSSIDLRGPRHREVLARLVAADGRMVATDTLVADLWPDPPAGAVGALRTFVATLRRALEPERPPRTPPRVLVTEGPGYALRLPRVAVDVHRFEDALAAARGSPGSPGSPEAFASLGEALAAWRGPAYADLPDVGWVRGERVRLGELRLQGVELRAGILLDRGDGADLVADLDAHVTEHPWREPAWGLLARALYRAGRRADALATLRRARAMLVDQLGLDPSRALRQLETDLLTQSPALEPRGSPWLTTTARLGPRTTVDVARALALAGGDALVSSRRDRLAAALAAERTGDVALTARVIGAYDVPAIWNRADDPEQSRAVVAAAERTLAALGPAAPADLRARLYATVAVESRAEDAAGPAREAEALARTLGDPALLAFALNGVLLQSFSRPGLAPRRDAVGAEIIALSTRHGLPAFAILGHLVRLQSASARGDLDAGSHHAHAAEELAAQHESPLVPVLTQWFRALVTAVRSTVPVGPSAAQAAAAYRAADTALEHAGMPGLHRGLLPLALLGLRLLHSRPAPTDPRLDWGPYAPWAAPLVLLAQGHREQARVALTATPEPPRDHLQEALWCLTARAAAQLGEHAIAARAARALWPARTEHAGAASGMLTLGPVERYRAEAEASARACRCSSGGSPRGRCQCLR